MAKPHELLITEALKEIRARSLSPVELVDSMIERLEATDKSIRAWVHVDADGARAHARQIQERRAFDARLAGIPMGFKDLYDVEGMPTAAGFKPWQNKIPARDADVVAHLRRQGMVLLGKTVTTQFAFSDPPPTRNPWDLNRTASGSSSGSGASVGARQVTAALGTQTTGSNLRPAAYNGIVGFKPSYGLLSRRGIQPLAWSMDHPGILARSVEDASLVLDAMGPADNGNFQKAAQSPRPPCFGLLVDWVPLSDPAIRQNMERTTKSLAAAGAEVRGVKIGIDLALINAAQWTLLQVEALELHRDLFSREKTHYLPRMRAMLEVAHTMPPWAHARAERLRRQIRAAVDALFDQVDVLLSPVSPDLPPLLSEETTGDYAFLAAWSMLGLPAFSVPSGMTETKLPLAIQLAARHGHDTDLFRAAAWCEAVLGRLAAPPL
jgi:Asp-tRNA(Asn)/Glu-tRNA(Gln) amidotransferase A subunit family amidase